MFSALRLASQHLTFSTLLLFLFLKKQLKRSLFMNNKDFLYKELSYHIIGAGFTIHRAMGPGFPESCYGHALPIELQRLGIPFTQQESFDVYYHDELCGHIIPILSLNARSFLNSSHLMPFHPTTLLSSYIFSRHQTQSRIRHQLWSQECAV